MGEQQAPWQRPGLDGSEEETVLEGRGTDWDAPLELEWEDSPSEAAPSMPPASGQPADLGGHIALDDHAADAPLELDFASGPSVPLPSASVPQDFAGSSLGAGAASMELDYGESLELDIPQAPEPASAEHAPSFEPEAAAFEPNPPQAYESIPLDPTHLKPLNSDPDPLELGPASDFEPAAQSFESEAQHFEPEPQGPTPHASGQKITPSFDHPPPGAQTTPEPIEDDQHCPKCGAPKIDDASCFGCGVVFAKIGATSDLHERRPKQSVPHTQPQAPSSGKTKKVAAPLGTPARRSASRSEDSSVFSDIPRALLVPFKGSGVLWLPIMAVLLLASMFLSGRIGFVLKFSYVGLLANYFAKSIAVSLNDEEQAPKLEKPNDIKAELVWPGMALIGLCLCLFLPPAYFLYTAVQSATAAALSEADSSFSGAEAYLQAQEQGIELETEPWDPQETFFDGDETPIVLSEEDGGGILRRADGRWVVVSTERKTVTLLPESASPVPNPGEQMLGTFFSNLPGAKLLLTLMFFLFGLYYWPMALAAGAMSDNLFKAFNPIQILPMAVRGGLEYAVITATGIVILAVLTVIVANTSLVLLIPILLGGLGYVAGVQGFLLGRMFNRKASQFPEIEAL